MSISALETLEAAEFPPKQARALAKLMEADLQHRLEGLVTKSDLTLALSNLATQADLGALKAEFGQMRVEVGKALREQTRWVLLCMISLIPICFGGMYWLLEARG